MAFLLEYGLSRPILVWLQVAQHQDPRQRVPRPASVAPRATCLKVLRVFLQFRLLLIHSRDHGVRVDDALFRVHVHLLIALLGRDGHCGFPCFLVVCAADLWCREGSRPASRQGPVHAAPPFPEGHKSSLHVSSRAQRGSVALKPCSRPPAGGLNRARQRLSSASVPLRALANVGEQFGCERAATVERFIADGAQSETPPGTATERFPRVRLSCSGFAMALETECERPTTMHSCTTGRHSRKDPTM